MDERVIKALGDPTRFQLLSLIVEEGCCVRALAHRCQLSESAVSQHLKILREADLVQGIKMGYYTHYRVNREAVQSVIDELTLLMNTPRKRCGNAQTGCSVASEVECKNLPWKDGEKTDA